MYACMHVYRNGAAAGVGWHDSDDARGCAQCAAGSAAVDAYVCGVYGCLQQEEVGQFREGVGPVCIYLRPLHTHIHTQPKGFDSLSVDLGSHSLLSSSEAWRFGYVMCI